MVESMKTDQNRTEDSPGSYVFIHSWSGLDTLVLRGKHVCVGTGIRAYRSACVWGAEVSLWWCSPGTVHLAFVRQGLSLAWGLQISPGGLASELQGSACLHGPSAVVMGCAAVCSFFLHGCWGWDSIPHAGLASTVN